MPNIEYCASRWTDPRHLVPAQLDSLMSLRREQLSRLNRLIPQAGVGREELLQRLEFVSMDLRKMEYFRMTGVWSAEDEIGQSVVA